MGYEIYPGGSPMTNPAPTYQYSGSINPNLSLTGGLNDLSSAMSIYGGLHSGTPLGDAIAASGGLKLAGNLSGNSNLSSLGGAIGQGAGLYSGLEQGGVGGYGQAAVDALRLGQYGANLAGNGALSSTLGSVATPLGSALSLYDFGKNWQSGDTGGDALRGAETGATIGSEIAPGIGTLIGGLGGGAIGALSSAFGGGKHDPETTALQNFIPQYAQAYGQNPQAAQAGLSTLNPQQSFEALAGEFDAKNNSPGHSEPIEQTWGRMQEGSFLNDIANQINSGYTSGTIKPGESASDVYSSVIDPYITSRTNGQGILGATGGEGGVLTGAIENLIGSYMNGDLTSNTPIGIKGQEDTTLPAFAGMTPALAAAAQGRKPQISPPVLGKPDTFESQGIANGVTPLSAFAQYAQQQQPQQSTPITQRPVMAQGGHMKKRKQKFDDGGSFDTGDFSDSNILGQNSGGLDLGLFDGANQAPAFDTGFSASNDPSGFTDTAGQLDPLLSSSAGLPPNSSSSGGKGIGGSLASLLSSLGLSPSTASTLSQLGLTAASLAPIIAALSGGKSSSGNATQPATTPPPGYGPPSAPFSVPNFSRQYVGPNTSNWTPEQWYKYGEGPEQNFFSNNQLPAMPGLSPSTPAPSGTPNMQTQPVPISQRPVMAKGGALGQTSEMHQGPGYVNDPGYGDGTSDDVNANLSGGEYVMDGGTVSLLGNGSNDAGARKLDQLRLQVRKHAGKSLVKGKQFMKAKAPGAYLGKGK